MSLPRAGTAHLGLGTNEGDREAALGTALDAIEGPGIELIAVSSIYETQPVGEVLDQPDFLNACALVATDLEPLDLLDRLKRIEHGLGRDMAGPRHGPRPIDIDLLMVGPKQLGHERLTLPHAELSSRRFVLLPLLEIDPDVEVPGAGEARRLLSDLPESGQRVVRVAPPPRPRRGG